MATHHVRIVSPDLQPAGGAGGEFGAGPLRVRTTRLTGGCRAGITLVELMAGDTRVVVVPERGLGIWSMKAGGVELGWRSPVRGPVHPAFVPLGEPSGLGWLDGFDELVARCGLVSNGAPEFDSVGRLVHGLHGRIANLPAHEAAATLDEEAGTITLSGAVDETRFLAHALRLETRLMLSADRPRLAWTDTVTNLSGRPATMQLLYHVNLGPPLLGAGSQLEVAIDEIAPRDAPAAADLEGWNRTPPPQAGRPEAVHFAAVRAAGDGLATALLMSPDGTHAAGLSWQAAALPCFTLWKNHGSEADGYVTGLEPATNYPNVRSFEEAQGRVVVLEPGQSARFDLALEHLSGERLAAARAAVAAAGAAAPRLHRQPRPGWSAVA